MDELRAAGKHVLLVGDLNLTWRPQDGKLTRQVLHIGIDGEIDGASESMGKLKDHAGTWCKIGKIHEKLKVPIEDLAKLKPGAPHLAVEAESVAWLSNLLSEKWVDVFAETHGSAEERFTSWNQLWNLRFTNHGSRLDFTICDQAAWEEGLVVRSPSTQLPGADLPNGIVATSSEAALNAATNFGKWHPAANRGMAQGEGLTLQADDMSLNNSMFPAESYTGLIYTPPAYSDHIAVSLLLKSSFSAPQGSDKTVAEALSSRVVATMAETRICQPWVAQSRLSAFFGPGVKRQKT